MLASLPISGRGGNITKSWADNPVTLRFLPATQLGFRRRVPAELNQAIYDFTSRVDSLQMDTRPWTGGRSAIRRLPSRIAGGDAIVNPAGKFIYACPQPPHVCNLGTVVQHGTLFNRAQARGDF
jgi:hypothetical protein